MISYFNIHYTVCIPVIKAEFSLIITPVFSVTWSSEITLN